MKILLQIRRLSVEDSWVLVFLILLIFDKYLVVEIYFAKYYKKAHKADDRHRLEITLVTLFSQLGIC